MKKNILLSLLLLISIQVMAQEKGLYVSLWGGVGPTGFRYNMTGIDFAEPQRKILTGGQAGLGVSYYFTKHVGISLGVGVSHYRTRATLKGYFQDYLPDKQFDLGEYTDNDYNGHITDYHLWIRTQNWTEFHSGKFFEIPLMLNLQKKFGTQEHFGVYLSVGPKFQIPIASRYSIVDGTGVEQNKLMISGYYEEDNLELGGFGGVPLSNHSFANIHNPSEVLTNAKGKLGLKFNLSLTAEAGFLISFSRRVDLALGAFIDGGILNINKKSDPKAMFTGPETDYVSGAEYNPGKGIEYNSILKSTDYRNGNDTKYVDKVKSISYGGKVGIRIKLGKLSEREEEQQKIIFPPCDRDTVYILQTEQIPLDSLLQEILRALKERPQFAPENTDAYYDDLGGIIPADIPTDDLEILFNPIYFDLDQAILRQESIRDLDNKVRILKKYPEIKLIIFGNTCDLGTDPHNFGLGQRRAEAARNYMVSRGIAPERLEYSTLSRFQPELPNTNEPNRTHNRRDDFKPVYPKK